jgi:hypothetical protein
MYYISITNLNHTQAKALGFLTRMVVVYDNRFKRHELRGTKKEHFKFLPTIKEFCKLNKSTIHDWVANSNKYKSKTQFLILKE